MSMNCGELLRILKATDPNLPVVIPSSQGGVYYNTGGIEVTEILRLPINPDNIQTRLVAIIREEG